MFNLLFKSWLVGLLSAGLILLPLSRIWGPTGAESIWGDLAMRLGVYVANIPLSMWVAGTVGAIVAMPVVVALGVCGWLFKTQMDRYPLRFALGATAVMLVIAAAGAVVVGEHATADTLPPLAQFTGLLISWISAVVAIPSGLATWFFAKRVTKISGTPSAYGAR